jgi:hypothetical protein
LEEGKCGQNVLPRLEKLNFKQSKTASRGVLEGEKWPATKSFGFCGVLSNK